MDPESEEDPMAINGKSARAQPSPSLHLHEEGQHNGASPNLLSSLTDEEYAQVCAVSSVQQFAAGRTVFQQGNHHDGIFIILTGQVRTYYTGPSGREITLAYWSPGNFVGGPEIFGGSPHMWSGQAVHPTQVLHVRGRELRRLMERLPRLAVALVEALVHKGKCYSALVHMLGTRSAAERLAQLLLLMADLDGHPVPEGIAIGRTLSQEDLAKMVGSTRQWVTTTLDRFREQGMIEITPSRIVIRHEDALRRFAG
jgi:CRP-like cAMP-binding protein